MRITAVQPYDGPYRVVRRKKKVFIVDVNGKPTAITIDRLKAAYIQADDRCTEHGTTADQTTYQTRSGRRVKIPRRYW